LFPSSSCSNTGYINGFVVQLESNLSFVKTYGSVKPVAPYEPMAPNVGETPTGSEV
jgi:hypothetical protein